MNRVTICIFLLFLLALGLSLPNWLAQEEVKPKAQTEEAWVPNYQARTMRSTVYNKEGNINHQVFAEKMEHFDLLGFTLFKHPEYSLFAQASAPWKINAKEATLYDDQRLQFETDVVVTGQTDDGLLQKVTTHFVEINLSDKTMTSDQYVNIAGPNYVINSNGFKVNLETQQYELLDHVKTVFQPSARH
jgi:lipopolysaccharide export system protein LptC